LALLKSLANLANGGFMIKKSQEQCRDPNQNPSKANSSLLQSPVLRSPNLPPKLAPLKVSTNAATEAESKSVDLPISNPVVSLSIDNPTNNCDRTGQSLQPPNLRAKHNSGELRHILSSVSAKSCPERLNFHLHTVFSDGRMQPEDIVNQAIAAKVSHIAITDHHTVEGYLIAKRMLQRLAQQSPPDSLPQLWVGVEINASLIFNEVHILGYGFDPDHSAMQPYLQGHTTAGLDYQCFSVIKAIHLAGGLAVLAHPARYRRSAEDLITAAANLGIDGLETYYGYDHCDPWFPSPKQMVVVKHLGDRHKLLHTCGTDSHGLKISRRL
jgi:predicted metal-dependent phosphoesterase TrpH